MTYKFKKINNITHLDFDDNSVRLSTNGIQCLEVSSSTGEIKIAGEYTLPITDGQADQVLKTDGNGNLSWTDQTSGGSSGGSGGSSGYTSSTAASGSSGATNPSWEFGRWFPKANGFTFSSVEGTYQKIGNMVTATFKVVFPQSFTGSVGSYDARITNLPCTSQTSHKGFGSLGHISNGQTNNCVYVQPNSEYIVIADHNGQDKQNSVFAGATLEGGVTFFVKDTEVSRIMEVSGATSAGPATLAGTTTTTSNWYSLGAMLGAGDRMVFSSEFIEDILTEMNAGDRIFVGIKDSSWANTKDGASTTDSGFQGNFSIYFEKSAGIQGEAGTVMTTTRFGASDGTSTTSTLGPVTVTTTINSTNSGTPWNKAIDFSGTAERIIRVNANTDNSERPLAMDGQATTVLGNSFNSGYTTNFSNGRPWATAIVFKHDGKNGIQRIWNFGDGVTTNGDNIYLKILANTSLYFGWGNETTGYNECQIRTTVAAGDWHAVYIAHTGERLGATQATATGLARCFDIRYYTSGTGLGTPWTSTANLSVQSNWTTTGFPMDANFGAGELTIGAAGTSLAFDGKIASMVVTTLRRNQPMPVQAEIDMLVKNPIGWLNDYKVGNNYRLPDSDADSTNFALNSAAEARSTQVWLMGGGNYDSFSYGIRNQVNPTSTDVRLAFLSNMAADDIEGVSIPGGLISTTVRVTNWNKAVDIRTAPERLDTFNKAIGDNPLAMGNIGQKIYDNAFNAGGTHTTSDNQGRPWATAIVFKADRHNSEQFLWHFGRGQLDGASNMYLRLSAAGELFFGIGQERNPYSATADFYNECRLIGGGATLSSAGWYGVYIAATGERRDASENTSAILARSYDIKIMNNVPSTNPGVLNWGQVYDVGGSSNWITTGYGTRLPYGQAWLSVGAEQGSHTFKGKIASMVVTTLKLNVPMPDDSEIAMMITDPMAWKATYKDGKTYRMPNASTVDSVNFGVYLPNADKATQIWLMGDGPNDTYASGIRNQVYDNAVSTQELLFQYGNANDIEDVDIDGLTETPFTTNSTDWDKAVVFSGGSQRLEQDSTATSVNPLAMNGNAYTLPGHSVNSGGTHTSNFTGARPWATAILFRSSANDSNQHVWNFGDGAGTGDDNIYLRKDTSGRLYFGWGREGSGYNECILFGPSGGGIQTSDWWGVYIAHTGERLSGNQASAGNLANCFDIRTMTSNDSPEAFTNLSANRSTSTNWTSNGVRMDRNHGGGVMTIGGRGPNRSFKGEVASMVVTTLKYNSPMPTEAEIEMMITDPMGWKADYKDGESFRRPNSYVVTSNFGTATTSAEATQIWLMGDGTNDTYPRISNQVDPTHANTKVEFLSMASNDIQTVTIPVLTSGGGSSSSSSGSAGTTVTSTANPAVTESLGAFYEISRTGDALRAALTEDSSNYNVVSTAYADWGSGSSGTDKRKTGDQGYNIASSEVVVYWDKLSGSTGNFDISEVDWTNVAIYDSASD